MTILTDGVLSDGFQAKIKIWSAGDFLGQVSGMNYLNPAACSIDLPRDRVELQFPGGVAAAHGASHLSTGTDPIPPGTLQISGVTGSFEIPGTLGVGTSPIPGRSLNIKSDGAARIYAENDGTAALEAEIKSSTDPILPNWLVLRGVNTTKTHFQDASGFQFSTMGPDTPPNLFDLTPSQAAFNVPILMQSSSIYLRDNSLYFGPNDEARIFFEYDYVSISAPVKVSREVRVTSQGKACLTLDAGDNLASRQAYFYLITLGDGWTDLGNPGIKGWHLTARGDGYVEEAQRNDLLLFFWDGTSRLERLIFEHDTGNLGIGTTQPEGRLDVNTGDVSQDTIVARTSDSSSPWANIRFVLNGLPNNPFGALSFYAPTGAGSEALRFAIKNTDGVSIPSVMVIDRKGDVGIGTGEPEVKFHVKSAEQEAARIESTSEYGALHIGGATGAILRFYGAGVRQWGFLTEHPGADKIGLYDYDNNVYRMVWQNNGNIGIGTTTPYRQLHIWRNSTGANGIIIENALPTDAEHPAEIVFWRTAVAPTQRAAVGMDYTGRNFFIWVNGQDRLNIDTDGKVGIGIRTPLAALHIEKSIEFPTVRVHNEQAGGEGGIRFRQRSSDGTLHHADIFITSTGTETGRMGFRVPYTNERLTILSDGNVGIGMPNPEAKLDINLGSLSGDAIIARTEATTSPEVKVRMLLAGLANSPFFDMVFRAPEGPGSERLIFRISNEVLKPYHDVIFIDDRGYVGIGKMPVSALDVHGELPFVGDTRAQILRLEEETVLIRQNLAFRNQIRTNAFSNWDDTRCAFEFWDSSLSIGSRADGTKEVEHLLFRPAGTAGIGSYRPDVRFLVDKETTNSTDIIFGIETDVAGSDSLKAYIQADGEFWSDVGYMVFSPDVPDDPLTALEEAVKEATKPKKPYPGLFADESLDELKRTRKKLKREIKELKKAKDKEGQAQKERELKTIENHISFILTARKHGVKSREDERRLYGKDIAKIAIGLAKYCSHLEERVRLLEKKLAAMKI